MKNKYLLGLVMGILLLAVTMIVSMVFGLLFPNLAAEYVNPAFRPWSDPLMMAFYSYPIVFGFIVTWLWLKTKKSWKSGMEFGLSMGLYSTIPSFIVNYSSFTFSLEMVLSWVLSTLVSMVVVGLALEKLDETK
jgi:hypothetical protein